MRTQSTPESRTASSVARRKENARNPRVAKCPGTCERFYEPDEEEYLRAVAEYQLRTETRFLSVCEYLSVAKSLGYRKS